MERPEPRLKRTGLLAGMVAVSPSQSAGAHSYARSPLCSTLISPGSPRRSATRARLRGRASQAIAAADRRPRTQRLRRADGGGRRLPRTERLFVDGGGPRAARHRRPPAADRRRPVAVLAPQSSGRRQAADAEASAPPPSAPGRRGRYLTRSRLALGDRIEIAHGPQLGCGRHADQEGDAKGQPPRSPSDASM